MKRISKSKLQMILILTIFSTILISLISNYVFAQTNFIKHPDNPVLENGPTGSWDSWAAHSPWIIFDGQSYKMWYTGGNGTPGIQAIGYATSSDGLNWEKYSNNPVLKGEQIISDLNDACVIKVDGEYLMFYSWAINSNSYIMGIGLATSEDGINWTKCLNNPVIILV